MKYFILLILFFVGLANAGNFSHRVLIGKHALASQEGKKYEASWGSVIQTKLTSCIPIGSKSPSNLGKFTFVAYVSQSGLVNSVEVEPSTPVSRCFALLFNNAFLPPPPKLANPIAMFPIADLIVVKP
jgi:hypothetical protein